MSKSKDSIKRTVRTVEGAEITPSTQFVYEVSIAKMTSEVYSLEDVKELKSKTFVPESATVFTKNGITFYKKIELIGAPESWIKKQKDEKII